MWKWNKPTALPEDQQYDSIPLANESAAEDEPPSAYRWAPWAGEKSANGLEVGGESRSWGKPWVWVSGICGVFAVLVLLRFSLGSTSIALEDGPNDLLVLYAYHETEDARRNAEFFFHHGLHDHADFIFILNGETDIEKDIPVKSNIRVINRPNTCYDLGAFGEVLKADDEALVKKYQKFITMNASVMGPFMPHWSNECWSDAFTNKLTEKNKLVGMTFNCLYGDRPHVQSMVLATDQVGVKVLLTSQGIDSCHSDYQEAVNTEIRLTSLIWSAGYGVDVLMQAWQSEPDYGHTCTTGDIFLPDAYFGGNVSPYELIFWKAKRNVDPTSFNNIVAWTDAAGYSSYDVCSKKKKLSTSTSRR